MINYLTSATIEILSNDLIINTELTFYGIMIFSGFNINVVPFFPSTDKLADLEEVPSLLLNPLMFGINTLEVFVTAFSVVNYINLPDPNEVVATLSIGFDSIIITNIPLYFVKTFGTKGILILREPFEFYLSCLHGSSLLELEDGSFKRIDKIKKGEKILSLNYNSIKSYPKIEEIVQCWLIPRTEGLPEIPHDCIIFEKDSLCKNIPSEKLIIDPYHPICEPKNYKNNGSLKPAVEFLNPKNPNIYIDKWTDQLVQKEDPSCRWDLVLEKGYNSYMASGMVVKSRLSDKDAL